MRDFCKISPQFWAGKTGKALRGQPELQVVAMYLMTSPHSNMIGIYQLPILYLAHETGMTTEGAYKALQSLCEAGFCTYEADSELIWVHEMAKWQVGENLAPKDNQCKGVQRELAKVPSALIRRGFAEKYASDFHLVLEDKKQPKQEAPSKPLATPLEAREGEEKDKEKINTPQPPRGQACRFEEFWKAWPSGERKQDKVKCAQKWKRSELDRVADHILQDVATKRQTEKWRGGFIEAPLVYLNGKRWEDGVTANAASESQWAGAI